MKNQSFIFAKNSQFFKSTLFRRDYLTAIDRLRFINCHKSPFDFAKLRKIKITEKIIKINLDINTEP